MEIIIQVTVISQVSGVKVLVAEITVDAITELITQVNDSKTTHSSRLKLSEEQSMPS